MNKKKYILGIESSCDDTCASVVSYENNNPKTWEILSDVRVDQSKITNSFGGVVPELSVRSHLDNLGKVFETSMSEAGIGLNNLSGIACTIGPGLIGSLMIASYFCSTICKDLNINFIPTHHLESHILISREEFPFLCLLVSGGHTSIILCEEFGKYTTITETLDDAAGEVFDKIGRELGMGFPSGKEIEQEALKAEKKETLPSSMPGSISISFSGLKTAFLHKVREGWKKEEICYSIQETIGQTLRKKLLIARDLTKVNKVVACGGVASNKRIREILSIEFNLSCPPINLCTDNGAMVAFAGIHHLINNSKFVNRFELNEFPRIKLEDYYRL